MSENFEPLWCRGCGKLNEDLRLSFCFDCATRGEERAAKRTVVQHLYKALQNVLKGSSCWRYDLRWAFQRLVRTGDYDEGGYFDRQGIKWR